MLPVLINPSCHRVVRESENFLLEHGSDEMISLYLKNWKLHKSTLEYLTSDLKICNKWEKLLSHEIERQKFPESALMNLVKCQKQELLKAHFEKYELSPEVLAFYANQEKFKKDLNI